MSADVFVRPATPDDAPALAAVQVAAWSADLRPLLGDEAVLPDGADAVFTQVWQAAVRAAPDARHRVLAAVDAGGVVGLAAVAPATDPDLDPATDAEVGVLVVHPAARRRGHGSRLLAAVADTAGAAGVQRLTCWVGADGTGDPLRPFLLAAGWAEDGASRTGELEDAAGRAHPVPQVRLHTALT